MKTNLADRSISTSKVNGAYEVAVRFYEEWLIIGSFDKETAIKKHIELETLSIKNILFRLRVCNIF